MKFEDIPASEIIKALPFIPEPWKETCICRYEKKMDIKEIMEKLKIKKWRANGYIAKGTWWFNEYFNTDEYQQVMQILYKHN